MNSDDQDQLVTWLEERGHSAAEIERILAKVAQNDTGTIRGSIFDAINSGEVDFLRLVEGMPTDGNVEPASGSQSIDTTRE